ncbi:site-2 protease family protein [Candidatus Nomurabacteria bacterium]|nr:site-2 protease family protein [Candidatus Nomurabacteria bacterium]USN95004.1 MAG: site-2 protease family protein [Candidatus Nomurabacteria bacterium]
MGVLLLIVVLFFLILVHEFGHLIVAKFFKIRVDEFGIGFPPRAVTLFRRGETVYTLNYIPFGGFVKIFGENYIEEDGGEKRDTKEDVGSFSKAPKYAQAATLLAGVFMNFIVAWILLSFTFMIGVYSYGSESSSVDASLLITEVSPDSPAYTSGILSGDVVKSLTIEDTVIETPTVGEFQSSVKDSSGKPILLAVERGGQELSFSVIPEYREDNSSYVIGVGMSMFEFVKYGFFESFYKGFGRSIELTREIWKGFVGIFSGGTDLSTISGPIGIVPVLSEASSLGFSYILFFTALISINLVILNLIPFPALDGGRLLFVIIESITKKRIPPKIFQWVNTIGFLILILLMVFISIKDIIAL